MKFEEWMADQRAPAISTLSAAERRMWAGFYEKACEAQRQVKEWTPKAARSDSLMYAAAIRDESQLWLVAWVRRNPKGEFFSIIPRHEEGWNPRSSYHRDGKFSHKSYNRKLSPPALRQRPDANFRGAEQILGLPVRLETARAVKALCDPKEFTGVLEIAADVARTSNLVLTGHVTAAGATPPALPWSDLVTQRRFTDATPEVVLGLWKQHSRQVGDGLSPSERKEDS